MINLTCRAHDQIFLLCKCHILHNYLGNKRLITYYVSMQYKTAVYVLGRSIKKCTEVSGELVKDLSRVLYGIVDGDGGLDQCIEGE